MGQNAQLMCGIFSEKKERISGNCKNRILFGADTSFEYMDQIQYIANIAKIMLSLHGCSMFVSQKLRCFQQQQLQRVQIEPPEVLSLTVLRITVAGPTCLLCDFTTWFVVQLVVFHFYLLQTTNILSCVCAHIHTHLDNLLAIKVRNRRMVQLQVVISH